METEGASRSNSRHSPRLEHLSITLPSKWLFNIFLKSSKGEKLIHYLSKLNEYENFLMADLSILCHNSGHGQYTVFISGVVFYVFKSAVLSTVQFYVFSPCLGSHVF